MGIVFFFFPAVAVIGDISSSIAASPPGSWVVTASLLPAPSSPPQVGSGTPPPHGPARAPPPGEPCLPAGSEGAGPEELRRL